MPKCGACGKNYNDPAQIELVRNQEDRWVPVCRECLEQGVDTSQLRLDKVAVDNHVASMDIAQAIDVTLAANPMDNVRKLLAAFKSLRQSKERKNWAKRRERKQIELTAYYTMARDDNRYEAKIVDFSPSGIRIATNRAIAQGQILQFDWNIPLPPSMARVLQSTGEVRRVVKHDNGTYDIGIRFMARQSDKEANRRRFRRYKCDMTAYYRCRGSDLMLIGQITDISQGGCQMRLDEKLETNNVLEVRMIGGGGAKGDLIGKIRVCRVIPRDSYFDTGCCFEKMSMAPQPARQG
ncbi:MAG: PilZ domain-containing protein [Planctomycetota bacterium]|jgi:c-di-GMP-binding flagellar brake protein YcgR|nr:PilZ domain-containing protein [Planctomycetota bacterium]